MNPPGAALREDLKLRTPDKPDIAAAFADSATIERTLNQAVREAVLRHKRLGQSIFVWRDGRVVEIPPEEISEDNDAWPPRTRAAAGG